MSRRPATHLPRRLARIGLTAAVLCGVLVGTVGFPITPPTGVGGAYPCEGNGCGCRSAEDCWFGCCCLSLEQRLAWAERNGVTPPAELVRAEQREPEGVRTESLRTADRRPIPVPLFLGRGVRDEEEKAKGERRNAKGKRGHEPSADPSRFALCLLQFHFLLAPSSSPAPLPREKGVLPERSQSATTKTASCCAGHKKAAACCRHDAKSTASCCAEPKADAHVVDRSTDAEEPGPVFRTAGCRGLGQWWVASAQPLALPERPVTLMAMTISEPIVLSSIAYSLDADAPPTRPG